MGGGLRVAGKVELGGVHAADSGVGLRSRRRPRRSSMESAAACTSDWMGFRPTMPDALPVVGRSRTLPCVFYAFGHQHVGWTLGGITGELIAELVAGKQPSIDLTPYALERFSPWRW